MPCPASPGPAPIPLLGPGPPFQFNLGLSVPAPATCQQCQSAAPPTSCPVPREVPHAWGWGCSQLPTPACPPVPREPPASTVPGHLAPFRAQMQSLKHKSHVPGQVTELRRRGKNDDVVKKSESEAVHLLAGFGKIKMGQGINHSVRKLTTGQTFVAETQLSVGQSCDLP